VEDFNYLCIFYFGCALAVLKESLTLYSQHRKDTEEEAKMIKSFFAKKRKKVVFCYSSVSSINSDNVRPNWLERKQLVFGK
jgi:hypothetical protein